MPMSKIFPTTSLNASLRMHEPSESPEYWFYHKESSRSECPTYYKQLVDNAESYIEIWDPYFNVKSGLGDQSIFADINNDITIKILTMKGLDRNRQYLHNVEAALKQLIPSAKNTRFGLRVINKGDPANQSDRFFHDRFLIIDQNKPFLVGASVEYHIHPRMSTGIFKITDTDTALFIRSMFNYYWNASSQDEIPVKFLHP